MTDKGYNRFGEIMMSPNGKIPKNRDWLLTNDIEGATPNAFGKLKSIQGRDYINITDIKGTQSGYQIDRFTNRKMLNLETKDVNNDGKRHFIKNYNPLEPKYVISTKSRRHKLEFGSIDKNKPKKHISPVTRRHVNNVDDIEGTKSKKRTWVRNIRVLLNDSENNTSLPITSSGRYARLHNKSTTHISRNQHSECHGPKTTNDIYTGHYTAGRGGDGAEYQKYVDPTQQRWQRDCNTSLQQ